MDNISSKFCPKLGYINCMSVCTRTPGMEDLQEGATDLALACENGLFFGVVSESGEFELLPDETLWENHTISQVIEIAPGQVMHSVFNQSHVEIRRRSQQKKAYSIADENSKIDLTNVSDLCRLPEYNYQDFPYVIARTKSSLVLINVRNRQSYTLLDEIWKPNFDNEFTAAVAVGKIDQGGSITVIYSSTKQDAVTDTIKILTLPN